MAGISVLSNNKKRATYSNLYEVNTFLSSGNAFSLLSNLDVLNSTSSVKLELYFPYIVFHLLGYADNASFCFQTSSIDKFDELYNPDLLDSYGRSFFNVGEKGLYNRNNDYSYSRSIGMYTPFARIKLASGRFYPIALGIDEYFRTQTDYLEEIGVINENHPLLDFESGGEYGVES